MNRIVAQPTDERHVHDIKIDTGLCGNLPRQFHFFLMFLPVEETQGYYFLEFTFGPEKASG